MAWLALDRQRAAMEGQQFSTDRQPEAATAEIASDGGVRLLERLAQRFQRRRIDADAGVGHNQSQRFARNVRYAARPPHLVA